MKKTIKLTIYDDLKRRDFTINAMAVEDWDKFIEYIKKDENISRTGNK